MFENIEAVIFDLDGTLVDSMGMWHDVDIRFMEERGFEMRPGLAEEVEGMSMTETAQWFIRTFNLNQTVDELKDEWNNIAKYAYEHEIQPKSYALDFLKALKQKGIKTGVSTSNSTVLMNTCLKATGIGEYIDVASSGCMVEHGKPAPDIYLASANALGVDPSKCLIFEDVINGIKAGKAAGMRTCAVPDDAVARDWEEKKELADYYIHNFSDAIKALNGK